MTSEIITLQLGNYSNHVATHWWNLQAAQSEFGVNSNKNGLSSDTASSSSTNLEKNGSHIEKNVLWRIGEDSRGQETCTPRTIILDEKHNMGTLSCSGGPLFDTNIEKFEAMDRITSDFADSTAITTWDGNHEKIVSEGIEYTEQQQALNQDQLPPVDVKNHTFFKWPDYSYTYFHPKSILIPTQEINTVSSIIIDNFDQPSYSFNNWFLGRSLWSRNSFKDTLEDNIRFYAEECDYLQGFQILADSAEFSGFSSISTHICNYFDDDYHKKAQIHFPISKFSENFLHQRMFDKSLVPSYSDWSGLLGKALIFYDLALSTSACDAITPLSGISENSIPKNFYDKFNPIESDYNSSSILACYLETITTPFRCSEREKIMRVSDIAHRLTSGKRRMFLDSKLCFRNDQVLENFMSVSGLDINTVMKDVSYSSLPVARGCNTSPDAYYSNLEKLYLNNKYNHFCPKILKTKKNKSKTKINNGEVTYADWCCNKSAGNNIRELFNFVKKIPKSVLASLSIKNDFELDEINEYFIGFEDVLDDYERIEDSSDESSDDY